MNKNIIRQIVNNTIYLLSLPIKKNDKLWVFGSWFGKRFADNSRYLYEYVNENHEELSLEKPIWITDSDDVYNFLYKKGFNVYKKWSFKSVYYHLKAGVHIIDQHPNSDLNSFFSVRAKKINLWHGLPLKKIGTYQDNYNSSYSVSFGNWQDCKILCTSEFIKNILSIAFDKKDENCLLGAYPRNHYLQNDLLNLTDLEIDTIKNLNDLKNDGYKVVFYLPTFRDKCNLKFLGTDLMEEQLVFFENMKKNKIVIVTKLHFASKMFHNDFITDNDFLINLDESLDVYPILKESDLLITDYSSVYFDYLYLDREIVFYPYDLDYYKNDDRGLMFEYNEFTPGEKAYDISSLAKVIVSSLYSNKYKKERNRLKNKLFSDYSIIDTIEQIKKQGKI